MHMIGIKYVETQLPKKPIKTVMILFDGDVVAEYPAKDFHKWMKEKVREIGEWLETGKVKRWHISEIKTDKDVLRYVG